MVSKQNPLKSLGKVVVNFSKMDILKMSNFEKLEVNVCKKFILLGHRAKYQKNHSKVVSIIFFILFEKQFRHNFLISKYIINGKQFLFKKCG
jgi:hypothetical protein